MRYNKNARMYSFCLFYTGPTLHDCGRTVKLAAIIQIDSLKQEHTRICGHILYLSVFLNVEHACVELMNSASNLHSSSPLLSNRTITTMTTFGSVSWTDFTVLAPCFHRFVHMPIARLHSRRRPSCQKNGNRAGNVNILLLHIH